ncbi:TauD/TfdA dioxygenase family protein [Aquicella lusitana]|uniref:3-(4-hydroxyphenyl)acrylonitrile synthase n=1 Tax=Aquicella lusitana TaxID=254246 RepID=A0A370GCG6_9COXI|nr:TauD/TfdA family dioxygenase [Aquicella lusitana]RDI41522.1 3-(4-hydroxyphenyl)acrylonitrile synthase [Aquicella lusitana]VVC72584.1 Pentalenolactone F synthase [Aquicella lusitana]
MTSTLSLNALTERKCHIQMLEPFGLEIIANDRPDFTMLVDSKILKTLVKQFRIVVLRGFAPVGKDSLVQYAKTIGPLLEWEFGNVMEMHAQEMPKNYLFTHGRVPFHWDGAFYREPRYLLFHCIEAPLADCGGETIFSDTHQIWLRADENEKSTWANIKITYKTEKLAHYGGCITVPLVQAHPDTQETILRFAEPVPPHMLNPVEVRLEETDGDQSYQFIHRMAERCYRPENCYIHTWQQNDFLIADNFALIHARRAFRAFSPRHLRRIQVL